MPSSSGDIFNLTQTDIILISILIIGISLSAFFSSSETAYSSVNRIRLKNLSEKEPDNKKIKRALYITEDFEKTLTTLLLGNNIVAIFSATISTILFVNLFGPSGAAYSGIFMTVIILIFGEILPKVYAKNNALNYSIRIANIVYFIEIIVYPISIAFQVIQKQFKKIFDNDKSHDEGQIIEDEIKTLLEESSEDGIIQNEEAELVRNALEFDDIKVNEIQTHRVDIIAIDINMSFEEITEIFIEERLSRLPIYEDNIDNIIGILSEREYFSLLVQNKKFDLRDILRDPIFIKENIKISNLLKDLQKNKEHIAIILDEFGGTQGLVTMEDILEELVGEIWDEHDDIENDVFEISDSTYDVLGDASISDVEEQIGINLPETNYNTISGWLYEYLEKIPEGNEEIEFDDFIIKVMQVDGRRIKRVLIKLTKMNM